MSRNPRGHNKTATVAPLTCSLGRVVRNRHELLETRRRRLREVPAHLDRIGALLLEFEQEMTIVVRTQARRLEEVVRILGELRQNLCTTRPVRHNKSAQTQKKRSRTQDRPW